MKRPRAPRLVTVAVFTTVTVLFWIFFAVYNVLTTTPKSDVSPELLEPINPRLNTDSLETIRNRVYFERGESVAPIIESVSPSPTSAEAEEVENQETEEATLSAELEG